MSGFDYRPNQYYILASSVVFYYDFALTLPQEIKHIWSSKFSRINVLLIALRYITAIGYVPILWLTFSPAFQEDPSLCIKLDKLPGIIGIVCQSLTSAFLIIRLFAIYDKRKWILYITVPLGLLNIALSCFAIARAEPGVANNVQFVFEGGTNVENIVSSVCFVTPVTSGQTLHYELSYIAIILFDTLIFILSVSRLGRMYRAKRLFHPESSIVNTILRDGTILYATLSISNVFNFIAFMLVYWGKTNAVGLSNEGIGIFLVSSGTNNELTHALSVILVSRIVFNLREAGTEIYEGDEEWRSRIERTLEDMQFRTATTIRVENAVAHFHESLISRESLTI